MTKRQEYEIARLRKQVEELRKLHALTADGKVWFSPKPTGRKVVLYELQQNRARPLFDLGPNDVVVVGRADG